MSDLISRSVLLEVMQKASERERGYSVPLAMIKWFMEIIAKAPTVEVKSVVHCKDCTWWEDEHVLLSDGTKRPYTEEEKKNCPTGVTWDIGINVGSRCMVNPRITNLFRNADDYCSRADMRKKVE